MGMLFIDYSLTGGCVICSISYPLASVLYHLWNAQQFAGNLSLLFSDLSLVAVVALCGFFLEEPGRRAMKSIQLSSFALMPLGLFILLRDPGEFHDHFSNLSGPITNEMLLYLSLGFYLVSTVYLAAKRR